MRKRYLAGSLAAVMLLSGMQIPASAEPFPDDFLPEWVPADFYEAVKFENQYGNTLCKDGYVCFVQRERTNDDSFYYTTDISGSLLDEYWGGAINRTYTFEMPQMPETDDDESWRAFDQLCYDIGLPSFMVENGANIDPYFVYKVTVYDMLADTALDITWNYMKEGRDTPIHSHTYAFEADGSGNVTETDIFGWLPDSITEFKAFTAANDAVSLHEGYLVYADDVSYDGGFDVTVTQEGAAQLSELLDYDINRVEIIPDVGGQGHNVRVYEAGNAGKVKITFTQEQSWNPGGFGAESEDHYFDVAEDGTITETEPFSSPVGDCNGDGVFDSADAEMLMQYLLGNSTLTVPEKADLFVDQKINARDLTVMKQMLLRQDGGWTDDALAVTLTLSTPYQWKAIDAAKTTPFTVETEEGQIQDGAHVHIMLYDADTGYQLGEFLRTDSSRWECMAELDVTDACTMQFYAKLTAEPQYEVKSNTVTISFSEVPPPA